MDIMYKHLMDVEQLKSNYKNFDVMNIVMIDCEWDSYTSEAIFDIIIILHLISK